MAAATMHRQVGAPGQQFASPPAFGNRQVGAPMGPASTPMQGGYASAGNQSYAGGLRPAGLQGQPMTRPVGGAAQYGQPQYAQQHPQQYQQHYQQQQLQQQVPGVSSQPYLNGVPSMLPRTPQQFPGSMQAAPSPAPHMGGAMSASFPANFPAPSAPGAPRKSGIILCFGDSLTAGVPNSLDTYPKQLEKLLAEANPGFMVKNAGVYGENCDTLLRRLQNAIAQATRSGPLAYIIILGGTNDMLAWGSPPATVQKLKQMHDIAANAPGSPCIGIMTMPPCRLFQPAQEQARQAVNEGLRQLVEQPGRTQKFLVDLDTIDLELTEDGVHFPGEGYVEFARRTFVGLNDIMNQ